MRFFRNPEIKRYFIFSVIFIIIFTVAGYVLGSIWGQAYGSFPHAFVFGIRLSLGIFLALCVFLTGIFFTGLHLLITWQRYRRIRELSRNIDALLHGREAFHFSDYREGELAILKVELSRLVLRLKEQSERLSQEKVHLASSLADISHQIRTPLTSIHLVQSLLAEPNLPQEKRMELLHQMSMLLNRIDWLIEALLKVSRLDAGTVTFQLEATSVSRVIQSASAPLAVPMELRGQQFTFSCDTGQENFYVDVAWTVEAIANILKNCMEHTPAGGSILVSTRQNAIFTELVIEDDGPGFDREDIPHLFERFYKGKNSGEQSIGIGLSLARMILSRQNATIKAENAPKGGARFTIHFYQDAATYPEAISHQPQETRK